MKHQTLPNTDLNISALCYGTAAFGIGAKGEDLARLIDTFRDAGGNFFDTAHCYGFWAEGGDGASERALAHYFGARGGREEVVIGTKGGHPGRPSYRTVDHYLSAGRIAADIDDSLARLDTDRIDLFWVHRDDTRLPVGEIIDTLNAEVARGRIRYLGASNWTCRRIAEANDYAAAHGLRGFVASEPEWSLAHKEAPDVDSSGTGDVTRFLRPDDMAWHRQSGLPVIPYSSTGRGYFATGGQAARETFDNKVSRGRLERAQRLAHELGRTPNQVALAWLMGQPFPVFPILGTARLEHLKDALGAAEFALTPEQVRWLAEG